MHLSGPGKTRGEPKPWIVAATMPECSEGTDATKVPCPMSRIEPLIDLDPGLTKNLMENA